MTLQPSPGRRGVITTRRNGRASRFGAYPAWTLSAICPRTAGNDHSVVPVRTSARRRYRLWSAVRHLAPMGADELDVAVKLDADWRQRTDGQRLLDHCTQPRRAGAAGSVAGVQGFLNGGEYRRAGEADQCPDDERRVVMVRLSGGVDADRRPAR
jgi:hypothetical protein